MKQMLPVEKWEEGPFRELWAQLTLHHFKPCLLLIRMLCFTIDKDTSRLKPYNPTYTVIPSSWRVQELYTDSLKQDSEIRQASTLEKIIEHLYGLRNHAHTCANIS